MKLTANIAALALTGITGAYAKLAQGFDYGVQLTSGDGNKVYSDYVTEFTAAVNLPGTDGTFTSARLYTMLQNDYNSDPVEAIQAAVDTNTSLLLGFWCSGEPASARDAAFQLQLEALSTVLVQYEAEFLQNDLLVGISVGSEDLYRASIDSQPDSDGIVEPGAGPSVIIDYIEQVRAVVNGTALNSTPIGHVDTWNAWTNDSNNAVMEAVDFVGVNSFPYYQSSDDNSPANLASLFNVSIGYVEAQMAQVLGSNHSQELWLTETGFPTIGETYNLAIPNKATAQMYFQQVGCDQLFGKYNTWWYILDDAPPPGQTIVDPVFGVVGYPDTSPPLYNLSCAGSVAALPSTAVRTTVTTSNIVLNTSAPVAFPAPQSLLPTSATPSSEVPITAAAYNGTSVSALPSTTTTFATATPSACPANLLGSYEFPHLIVPVSSVQPTIALGDQYFGTINNNVSTLYNFDVNPEWAGRTCSLVFLFPNASQLVTSSYTFNSQGGLAASQLTAPATINSTYDNTPAGTNLSSINPLQQGGSYVISSGPCAAGQTIGYELGALGGLSLNYFQDYDPAAPIGLYIRIC